MLEFQGCSKKCCVGVGGEWVDERSGSWDERGEVKGI
jgi:hypothetical protein